MEYETIVVTKEEGYATVLLNNPDKMNAISREMRHDLADCFTLLEGDDSVRAVIITGGDYVFSAGMDIKEMAALAVEEVDDYIESIVGYLQKIYTFKKPVIAAVGGIALGGGFNLAAVCDIIIASESAIFGHPELKFGLNPLFDPLRRIVGTAKAKEIAMLGEPIGAREAQRIGLANKVVPHEEFMKEARVIAKKLSQRLPRAIEAVKKMSDLVPRLDKSSALERELEISAILFSRSDSKEYLREFIKRLKKKSE